MIRQNIMVNKTFYSMENIENLLKTIWSQGQTFGKETCYDETEGRAIYKS